jgi:hypothetical protein
MIESMNALYYKLHDFYGRVAEIMFVSTAVVPVIKLEFKTNLKDQTNHFLVVDLTMDDKSAK